MPKTWRDRTAAAFFPGRSAGWIVDISGVLLVLVGCAIDLSTDRAYSPLPFFVLPIIYVAWFSPHRATSWVCIGLITASDFVVAYSDDFRISPVEAYSVISQIATVTLVYWALRRLRTNALELREAKARLESLNREKDMLFGVISHDLRGALSVMLSSSRLMARSPERLSGKQLKAIADRTETAAAKSLVLLEDLLEWSRLQIGGATLKAHPVPVGSIIGACVEAAACPAEERNVRLTAEEIPASLAAMGDERAIRTVLRNLIGNALKFTAGGGEVRIAAWAADGEAVLSVKDSGIGIAPEQLQRLLSSGATSPASGVRGETGMGFGLSMCKDILARFGGRLHATSALGEGSEFFISLPRGDGAGPPTRR